MNREFEHFYVEEKGAIAPLTAVGLVALFGLMALSIDGARMFNLHTQLQDAVDAAAIAGATQLDGEDGARARASQAVTTALASNFQRLATDGLGGDVTISSGNIKYLLDLETRVEAASDAEANFIEVSADPRDMTFIFGGLVGAFFKEDMSARAVAGYGRALCKVPPLMICKTALADLADADGLEGYGITLRSVGGGGSWVPGNFGFLAPDTVSLGANELRDALGRINPRAACLGRTVTTEPGQNDAARQGFNTRFDIYEGNARHLDGDEQYRPARNVIKGLVRTGSQCGMGGQGWRDPDNPYTGDGDTDGADTMPLPRDRCAYPDYIQGPGDPPPCAPGSGGRVGNGDWAIGTYFETVHGITDWRAALGLTAADPVPTRRSVYEWERDQLYNNPGFAANLPPGEEGLPVCASPTPVAQVDPDRRFISAVVLDCEGESGRFSKTPHAFIDMFITEPMAKSGSDRVIYAEIIGQTSNESLVGGETFFNVVQLYE